MKKIIIVLFSIISFLCAGQTAFGYTVYSEYPAEPYTIPIYSQATSTVSGIQKIQSVIDTNVPVNSYVSKITVPNGIVYIQKYTDTVNSNICYYSFLVLIIGGDETFVNCVPIQ